MSDIEGLHTLLRESEQRVQGGVTWSESELMMWDEVIGGKELFYVNCDDGFHDLGDWNEAKRTVVKGIRFFTFLCNTVMFADFQADGQWPCQRGVQEQRSRFLGPVSWCRPVQLQNHSRADGNFTFPGAKDGVQEHLVWQVQVGTES